MQKRAVVLTIGDEILSGDVHDENSYWIAKRLFSLGVELSYIFVIPDKKEIITEYINKYRKDYDYIITLGGMGPTPDDVTKEAVADAFGVKLETSEQLVDLIQIYYNGQAEQEKFLMAIMPEKSEAILTSDKSWAIGLKMENVFSFPGTPFLVKDAFPTIEHLLKSESPIYKVKVNINCEETGFADIMVEIVNQFPDVNIGSYPSNEDFRNVKLLFKSRDRKSIEECRDQFVYRLQERYSDLDIS